MFTTSVRGSSFPSLAAMTVIAIGIAGLMEFAGPVPASANTGTLAERATERHVPVTVAIIRTDNNTAVAPNNVTTVATEALVRSVRSDGKKGIILEFEGRLPSTVSLTEADYDATGNFYQKKLSDGTDVLVWTHEPSLRSGDPAQGLSDYRYANLLGGSVWAGGVGHQFRLVYGRKTPRRGLPTCSGAGNCTAFYSGVLGGEIWPAAEMTDEIRKIRGNLEIVADFGGASLNGTVWNISGTEPGEFWLYFSWPTSRIAIQDGKIVDERFTATLTGSDNGKTVDLSKSVAGFGGNISGEFYGPAGEELGGVFSATRYLDGSDNDAILEGYILGSKTATGDVPISVAVRRARGTSTAMPRSSINAIRSDGAGGVIVDIRDSSPTTVHFTRSDLRDARYGHYQKVPEGGEDSSIWSNGAPRIADDITRGSTNFRHLSVLGTSIKVAGKDRESSRLIVGQTTPPGQLPACSGAGSCEAHYAGQLGAFSWDAASSSIDQRQRIWGDQFDLTADFARGDLHGSIKKLRGQTPGAASSDPYTSWSTSEFAISDGQITGGLFNATITGIDSARSPNYSASAAGYNGFLKGGFYGPSGTEVGGVMSATRDVAGTANDRVIEGHVIGRRSSSSLQVFDTSPVSDGVNRYDFSTSPRIELYGTDDTVNAVFTDGNGNHLVSYAIGGVARPRCSYRKTGVVFFPVFIQKEQAFTSTFCGRDIRATM